MLLDRNTLARFRERPRASSPSCTRRFFVDLSVFGLILGPNNAPEFRIKDTSMNPASGADVRWSDQSRR